MNKSTVAVLIAGVLAISAGAAVSAAASKKNKLSPTAEKFIRSIGIDINSPDVQLAIADGTIETYHSRDELISYSLESLAREKNKSHVTKFIATRALIHKLKTDFEGTQTPPGSLDMKYLTLKERYLVMGKVDSKPMTGVLAIPTGASEPPTTKKAGSAATPSKKKGLSPAAEKFIRSIGLDPQSPDVKLAIAGGTIESPPTTDEPSSHSLESLAKGKFKVRVNKFIKARVLIHKLKTDFEGTPSPVDGVDMEYMTLPERRLVMDKMFPKSK